MKTTRFFFFCLDYVDIFYSHDCVLIVIIDLRKNILTREFWKYLSDNTTYEQPLIQGSTEAADKFNHDLFAIIIINK